MNKEIYKKEDELIEFKDAQYNSFYSFFSLNNDETVYSFEKLFKEMFKIKLENDLILMYDKFEIVKDFNDTEQIDLAKDINSTICMKINIFIKIVKIEDNIEKVLFKEKYFLCDIPCIFKDNTFFINGNRRVVVPGILKNKGIMFLPQTLLNSQKNKVSCNIRPEKGFRFNIQIANKYNNLELQINKKKIPFFSFLTALYKQNLDETFSDLFGKVKFNNNISEETLQNIIDNNLISLDILYDYAVEQDLLNYNFKDIQSLYKTNILLNRKFDESSYYLIPIEYKLFVNFNLLSPNMYKQIQNANDILSKLKTSKLITNSIFDLQNMFLHNTHFNLSEVGRIVVNRQFNTKFTEYYLLFEDYKNIMFRLLDIELQKHEQDDLYNISNKYIYLIGDCFYIEFRNLIIKFIQYLNNKLNLMLDQKQNTEDILNIVKKIINSGFNTTFTSKKIISLFTHNVNSQYLNQINPLSDFLHKTKIISAGQGGISKDYASSDVRNVHSSYFGRICCLSTPEGQNAGIVNFSTMHLMIDKYGFLYTPYYRINKTIIDKDIVYVNSYDEYKNNLKIASFTDYQNIKDRLVDKVLCKIGNKYVNTNIDEVDVIQVYPNQLFSVGASLVPFFEHNDNNRNTTAANMQRQSCPLLYNEKPLIRSGFEEYIIRNSYYAVYAKNAGIVTYVDSSRIDITTDKGIDSYYLLGMIKSNSDTAIGHRTIVNLNQKVNKDEILADTFASRNGLLSLGVNLKVALMPFKGLNFEDSVIVSERCVNEKLLTSIVVNEYKISIKKTNFGREILTKNLPRTKIKLLTLLDDDGIIKIGSFVNKNDILVGKLTPKVSSWFSKFSDKLWRKLVGDEAIDFQNTSLFYNDNEPGIVTNIFRSTINDKNDIIENIVIWIVRESHIKEGDKICGRFGNKQIISRILPVCDMPYNEKGEIIDVIMNPLGVTSRMNIGQLMEMHANLVNETEKNNNIYDASPYSSVSADYISNKLEENNLPRDGKIWLFDGLTGEKLYNRITVGNMYILKLEHMVDLKFHSRSIGPNSMLTLQPVGGKNRYGAQRCGEMEQWVLEAYGVTKTILEKNTLLSDDIQNLENLLNIIIFKQGKIVDVKSNTFNIFKEYLFALGINLQIDKQKIKINKHEQEK